MSLSIYVKDDMCVTMSIYCFGWSWDHWLMRDGCTVYLCQTTSNTWVVTGKNIFLYIDSLDFSIFFVMSHTDTLHSLCEEFLTCGNIAGEVEEIFGARDGDHLITIGAGPAGDLVPYPPATWSRHHKRHISECQTLELQMQQLFFSQYELSRGDPSDKQQVKAKPHSSHGSRTVLAKISCPGSITADYLG